MANSFDKTPTPKETMKQYAMLGVAAVGLFGVLAWQWSRKFPAPADAAMNAGDANANLVGSSTDDANPAEITAQAIAAIKDDPTASISLGPDHAIEDLKAVPVNPFAMSNAWLSEIRKPEPIRVEPTPVATVHTTSNPEPRPEPRSVPRASTFEPFKIQGIIKTSQGRMVIVDGNVLGTNSSTHHARITQIFDDRIIVKPNNSELTYEIPLAPDSK